MSRKRNYPAAEYIEKKETEIVETRYLLRSVNADRTILRVGKFPIGIWNEVPYDTWATLKDEPGWEGKIETKRK